MKSILASLFLFSLSVTCYSQKIGLEKRSISSHESVIIETKVIKYQKKKERFYGTITTTNNSSDTLIFNLNQNLIMGETELVANYNYKPISYADIAFYLYPFSKSTWDVVWETKGMKINFDVLTIKEDLTIRKK